MCKAEKTASIVLLMYSAVPHSHAHSALLWQRQSPAEAQNKPAALITEQFPKRCNNNSMPTVNGGCSNLSPLTSGCSSDSLPNMAWSIQNEAAFQKTTEGAFVL